MKCVHNLETDEMEFVDATDAVSLVASGKFEYVSKQEYQDWLGRRAS